ncbi:hypothetical protein [Anaerotignum propionicum]|uniref:DUF3899 domain-containing protein n=1 Tax=Anaerotignum propionicum DSM 1682 TaxID=991789 RepID=A0ABM5YA04_ANAPI|nr:hypothetical protein [Anaerotignum propionicum]AMJ40927.1 hypothetical protein CPRO_13340 [Anaerotignum propionicum DSM 1682]
MSEIGGKIRYLEMIQGIINRMANNSFMLKGWAVTLVAGIFALASKEADKSYFLIAYVPIIIFWGMDSYYLFQERLFRSLYNKVRNLESNKIDFSMKATKEEFNEKNNQYLCVLFSPTELWFYFPLAALSAGIIILTHI